MDVVEEARDSKTRAAERPAYTPPHRPSGIWGFSLAFFNPKRMSPDKDINPQLWAVAFFLTVLQKSHFFALCWVCLVVALGFWGGLLGIFFGTDIGLGWGFFLKGAGGGGFFVFSTSILLVLLRKKYIFLWRAYLDSHHTKTDCRPLPFIPDQICLIPK